MCRTHGYLNGLTRQGTEVPAESAIRQRCSDCTIILPTSKLALYICHPTRSLGFVARPIGALFAVIVSCLLPQMQWTSPFFAVSGVGNVGDIDSGSLLMLSPDGKIAMNPLCQSWGWGFIFLLMLPPMVLYILCRLDVIPESPRFLYLAGKREEGYYTLLDMYDKAGPGSNLQQPLILQCHPLQEALCLPWAPESISLTSSPDPKEVKAGLETLRYSDATSTVPSLQLFKKVVWIKEEEEEV